MKRILSILLALCCLLPLCACGASAPAQSADPSETPAQPAEAGNTPESPAGEEPKPLAAVLTEPVYPSMAPSPRQEDYLKDGGWTLDDAYFEAERAWWTDLDALRNQPEGYADPLMPYFRGSIRQFLSGAGTENRVFSPLNLYMALAMLSEVTDGNSRQQLLDLLGAADLETLRSQAGALWRQSYQSDGVTASVLASSLWMNRELGYEPEALAKLAEYYYASAFQGEMGSQEYDALFQSWINEQTGGLLQQQASALHLDPRTVLALATTIYFKAPWVDKFSEALTQPGSFFSPEGEQTVDFLQRREEQNYFWGEHFSALALPMENGGAMWLLLPDEGLTPEELLQDEELMDFLLLPRKTDWERQKDLLVNLKLPKFDVCSDLDLAEGLRSLGITDVFDPAVSDFTPLTRELDEIFVSRVKHAARVLIDEEGCEAAAYTVIMMAAGAAMPPDEEVDFVLDRPFLFVITNAGGLPLFTGIVNHPAA